MSRRSIGMALAALGVGFLVFYLTVRLVFMQELDAAVAKADVRSLGDLVANRSGAVLIWAIWGYSFRVGMLLAVIGGAIHAGMNAGALWLLTVGGALYLATCYVRFVDYSPRYYGILGTVILVLFLFLVRDWVRRRSSLSGPLKAAGDLRMVGHYFLVTATWSLCGIFGIVTYALQPEIMLARGLQPAATMLTSHVMAELTLGWFFLALASRKEAPGTLTAARTGRTGAADAALA